MVAFARVMISWLSLFALIPYAILVPESAPGAIPEPVWRLPAGAGCDSGHASRHACWRLRGAAPPAELRSLRWVGERSYGLYLWHWPLAVVMHYLMGADRSPLVNVGVLVATFAIAEMSYRWVETDSPLRFPR